MQHLFFHANDAAVDLAVVEKQDKQQPAIANDCQHSGDGEKIAQGTEKEHGQPVEHDDFLRMQLNREVAVPADHRQPAEVPAVEGGKGVQSEQGQALRPVVRVGEGEKYIQYPGDGGDQ